MVFQFRWKKIFVSVTAFLVALTTLYFALQENKLNKNNENRLIVSNQEKNANNANKYIAKIQNIKTNIEKTEFVFDYYLGFKKIEPLKSNNIKDFLFLKNTSDPELVIFKRKIEIEFSYLKKNGTKYILDFNKMSPKEIHFKLYTTNQTNNDITFNIKGWDLIKQYIYKLLKIKKTRKYNSNNNFLSNLSLNNFATKWNQSLENIMTFIPKNKNIIYRFSPYKKTISLLEINNSFHQNINQVYNNYKWTI